MSAIGGKADIGHPLLTNLVLYALVLQRVATPLLAAVYGAPCLLLEIADVRASLNRTVQLSSAANDFTTYAKAMLASGFRPDDALTVPNPSPRLRGILKTGVVPGSTTGSTWGDLLVDYKLISDGFAASLAPFSAYDRIFSDNAFMRVPLKTRTSIATSAAQGGAKHLAELHAWLLGDGRTLQ